MTPDPVVDTPSIIAICQDCGSSWGALAWVELDLLQGSMLRRCQGCGSRWILGDSATRRLPVCDRCDLPFLIQPGGPEDVCDDCLSGAFPADLSDPTLTAATEVEALAALTETWKFVGAQKTSDYLDRVARQVSRRVEGTPETCRVLLVADPAIRLLALPTGTLLMTEGALHAIEDEAELAFVLGHELAHVAAADAARPLARMGLRSLAHAERDRSADAWSRACLDLIRLGYGPRAELAADARSLEALVALGYDPDSARRFLERTAEKTAEGSSEYAEYALAHPPAADRLRRLSAAWFPSGPVPSTCRVDREVFRRAAGHSVLASELETVSVADPQPEPGRKIGIAAKLAWTVLVILLLASLFLLFGLL